MNAFDEIVPVGPQVAGAQSVYVGACSACYVLVQQHRPTTNEMLMALLCARCRQGVEIALRHPEPLEAVVAVGMCRPCHDKMAPIVASGRSPSPELLCAPCRERLDATMKRARGLVDRTRPS